MSGWHVCEAAPWLPEPIIRDARGWAVATAVQPNNSRAAGIDAKENARLIAAAPAMRDALAWLEQEIDDPEALSVIREALGKARA